MSAIIVRSLILAALLALVAGCTKPAPEAQNPPMTQGDQPGAPPVGAPGAQPGAAPGNAVPPGTDPKLGNYTGQQPVPR